jgi:arginine N-succinyltransferase
VAGRFFGMNFQDADAFNAVHGNQFIADLMPRHPIYTAMLSESARSVIGLPHPSGRAAMRMLENEGFAFENYIDIFDGGPTMTVRTDNVRTIREAVDMEVREVAAGGKASLIATGRLAGFRACLGHAGDGTIDAESTEALEVGPGAVVSHVGRV